MILVADAVNPEVLKDRAGDLTLIVDDEQELMVAKEVFVAEDVPGGMRGARLYKDGAVRLQSLLGKTLVFAVNCNPSSPLFQVSMVTVLSPGTQSIFQAPKGWAIGTHSLGEGNLVLWVGEELGSGGFQMDSKIFPRAFAHADEVGVISNEDDLSLPTYEEFIEDILSKEETRLS